MKLERYAITLNFLMQGINTMMEKRKEDARIENTSSSEASDDKS